MQKPSKDHDLISTLSLLLDPFGYSVERKIQAKKQRWHQVKLLFFAFLFVFQLIIYIISEEDGPLLETFGDTGFYYVPNGSIRKALSRLAFCVRSHWILSQLAYVLDDYTWVRCANPIFHRVESISIPRNMIRILPKMRLYNLLTSTLFLFMRLIMFFIRFRSLISNGEIKWIHYFHGILSESILYNYHTYYSGMFVCELLLLLNLAEKFCSQFSDHYKKILRKPISRRDTKEIIIQFESLYELMQHLNSHMAEIYAIFVFFCFSYCVCLYEFSFDQKSLLLYRVMASMTAVIFCGLVIYFSWIAGAGIVKIHSLSTKMYHTVVLRQKASISSRKVTALLPN